MYQNSTLSESRVNEILTPQSIAVIGASQQEGTIGFTLFNNLIHSNYKGQVFAINPKYSSIEEYKCYSTISEINDDIQLAVIATPAASIPHILLECAEHDIHSVLILSAGFNETGDKGIQLYHKIKQICQDKDISVIGPNCIGIINPWQDLNLGFYSRQALPGKLAFISQSGALSASILDWAVDQSIGFSSFVSVGSMMDINFSDLLEYYENDENTDCILLYIESLKDGNRFIEVASRVSQKKPIIAIKAGKSLQGAKAATSHTGALAANDKVYDAAFQKAGIVRVDTIAELFHAAQAFTCQPIPNGPNLAIVTNAGGPAVMATDMLIDKGGKLAQLSPITTQRLNTDLPKNSNINNPIDVLGDASDTTFSKAIDICMEDKNVDGVIAIFTTQGVSDPTLAAQTFAQACLEYNKPILACWMGEADIKDAREIFEKAGIPNYRYPESAVNVFLKMAEYNSVGSIVNEIPKTNGNYNTIQANAIIQYAGVQNREQLTEIESKQILNCYNIPTPRSFAALNEKEAIDYANQIGYPVVMKVISQDIGHKLDVGGIVLNINDSKEIKTAYQSIHSKVKINNPEADILGVLIEKMMKKEFELLIGGIRDTVFGPVIIFGMGGSLVELWNDTHMSLAPLSKEDAIGLIKSTKAHTLISGFRGMPAIDEAFLADVLVNFSYLIRDLENISEIDLNPFAIDAKSGLALDAHILIR